MAEVCDTKVVAQFDNETPDQDMASAMPVIIKTGLLAQSPLPCYRQPAWGNMPDLVPLVTVQTGLSWH